MCLNITLKCFSDKLFLADICFYSAMPQNSGHKNHDSSRFLNITVQIWKVSKRDIFSKNFSAHLLMTSLN